MKIGIILHPFEEKPAGLGRAILELVKSLLKQGQKDEFTIFLKEKPSAPPSLPGENWQLRILGKKFLWLDRGLKTPPILDIYIFNTPILPLFFKPKKSIVIVYDFAYRYFRAENLKEFLKNKILGWYHNFSIKKSDLVIAISEATKNDIIKFSKIPAERIKVLYLGFNKICSLSEEPLSVPDKFFLFVGVIKERKNVLNLIKAFREFLCQHSNFKLVIAGKEQGQYFAKIKKYINTEKIGDKVIFLGYVSDGQMAYLYKKAQALVFPSFCEGFGLPVLEAMDCGLPVITSCISSLAELATPDSALLVDPCQPVEIKEAMEKLVSDENLRNNLVKNGLARAQEFSWEKTAKEFYQMIKYLF